MAVRVAWPRGSDADVLIVLRASDQPFHSRIDRFSGQFSNIGVPVDVLPVTISELETKRVIRFGQRSALSANDSPKVGNTYNYVETNLFF